MGQGVHLRQDDVFGASGHGEMEAPIRAQEGLRIFDVGLQLGMGLAHLGQVLGVARSAASLASRTSMAARAS